MEIVALVGGAVLIVFVVARWVLALGKYRASHERLTSAYRETVALNHELQATRDELWADNRALSEANASLQTLATTDPLTDLPNPHTIAVALDHELERAHRYNRPCAVLLIDLDYVTALDGARGRPVDDHALRALSTVMRSSLRGVDILGRWGGGQFVALLPETGLAEALAAAEHLRASVAAHPLSGPRAVHLTCSIGVAAYPHDGVDRAALVDAAGHAVSAAKSLGRNQVRAAGEPAVAALGSDATVREMASLVGTVEALATLVEARDLYTGRHTREMAALTVRLALASGCDAAQARLIALAVRLHDVGKVAVPDATLQKPGRLSDDDWALMRTHPGVWAVSPRCVP